MRDVHSHNRVEEEKKNLQGTNCLDKSDFCIKEQTCQFSFPSWKKKKKTAWNDSSSCLIAWKKRIDGSGGFITWRNNRRADKDVCDICIYFAKQIIKCSTFTTCSQLICPKHAIPFYIPQPLQLKKKTPCCYKSFPYSHYFLALLYFPLSPIISLFQICNLLFIFFLCLVWPCLSAPY